MPLLGSRRHKHGICGTLCVCFCCAVIWGGISLYFWDKSYSNVKHECEIYHITTNMCRYACGTICHHYIDDDIEDDVSLKNVNDSDTDTDQLSYSHHSSSTHCYTRYCWGYEYVYYYKTMDWKYHPHLQDSNSANLIPFDNSYFIHPSNTTLSQMNVLLEYLNDQNDTVLTESQIKSMDLETYIKQSTKLDIFDSAHIEDFLVNSAVYDIDTQPDFPEPNNTIAFLNSTMSSTASELNVKWCDNVRPVTKTYGTCSRWPYQYYDLDDEFKCWSNKNCDALTFNSPAFNDDLFLGFGFTAFACIAICVLCMLYAAVHACYNWCRGRYEYDQLSRHNRNRSFSNSDYYNTQRVVVNEGEWNV